MTDFIADFSSLQKAGNGRSWLIFFVVLVLHIAVFYVFLPINESSVPSAPVRISVQMAQLQAEPEPLIQPPPKVVKPLKQAKPLLTGREDLPPKPEDTFVPEQKIEVADVDSKAPIVPIKEIKPEPIKPKKVEPKKVKLKPKLKPSVQPKLIPHKPVPKKAVEPQSIEKTAVEPVEKVEQAEVTTEQSEVKPTAIAAMTDSINSSQLSTSAASTAGNSSQSSGLSNQVSRNQAWNGYGKLLYAMVSKNKTYPQQAIRRHLEGMVMVQVRFNNGRMVDISVLGKGSGHKVLDKAARKMLEKAVRAMPVKGELSKKTFTVVVPVDFRLLG